MKTRMEMRKTRMRWTRRMRALAPVQFISGLLPAPNCQSLLRALASMEAANATVLFQ
uniref:Uncharacterized protein n=1 Tax=Arundo donax TaxID=35708 RepID=A0A0A9EB21_ARUDO